MAAPPGEAAEAVDCVVIGAGLSGLYAAAQLRSRRPQASVLVLEARRRAGGRCHTRALPVLGGAVAVDVGPAWFWPGQSAVEALAQALGVGVFEQHCEGRAVAHSRQGVQLVREGMPRSFRVPGGAARLVEGLLEQVGAERVLLGRAATRVFPTGVEYLDRGTGEAGAVRCRCVVLAAPPRVVCEAIAFEPPLPPRIASGLRGVGTWMATSAKFFAVYSEPFWRQAGLSGEGFSGDGPLGEVHDAGQEGGAHGVLFGFFRLGPSERRRVGPEGLRERCLAQLAAMFGDRADSPLTTHLEDWSCEGPSGDDEQGRWTCTQEDVRRELRGHPRYSTFPALLLPADSGEVAVLGDGDSAAAVGEGRASLLVFAGSEACGGGSGGFMEGALQAGQAAAAAVDRALG